MALDTLGCKVNQAETELLAKQFAEAGYQLVSSVDACDVYILNTCTVTHIADRKSRHLLRLVRKRNPEALVVVTGCYVERAPQELVPLEVDLVVSNEDKPRLRQLLEASGRIHSPGNGSAGYYEGLRTRAFIKAQDGCSSFCSYCIVPLVRRQEQSVPAEQVVAEVKHRLEHGYKEVVLTGVKIGAYYYNGVDLTGLLERILAETDVIRLRLSSLQPDEISPELIGLWHDRRLCCHFHLSLQSGSDTVLRRMKRRYPVDAYRHAVSLVRSVVPDVAITTDLIVGFPGETDREFEESFRLCRELGFARIHVFPFSPRQGTEAACMPQPVTDKVKKERTARMLALAEESAERFRRQFLGRVMSVLWEKQDDVVWSGLTDNYIRVYSESNEDLTNRLVPVKLVAVREDGVWGEVAE